MKIDNVKIKSLKIGIETGIELEFDDPSGVLSENEHPCFCVPHYRQCKNEAESLGWRILALCWVLDHWHHLRAENEVIRVRHDRGSVVAIGNSVLDRWIGSDIPIPDLAYPFYSGVPTPTETPATSDQAPSQP